MEIRDTETLKMIGRVGLVTNDFFDLLDTNQYRINKLIKNKYLKKEISIIYGKPSTIYTLSEYGNLYAKSNYNFELYKSNKFQLEHDYALAKVYLFLRPDEKQSWLTESDLRLKYPDEETVIDGLFEKNQKKYGVEIISDTYKKDFINKKLEFINKYCNDSIVINLRHF